MGDTRRVLGPRARAQLAASALSGALVALVALVAAPRGEAQAQAQTPSASAQSQSQRRFAQGVTLFRQNNFAAALAEFRAALALFDSPNTRLLIGRCLRGLDRPAEAWEALDVAARNSTTLLATAPQYRPTLEAAQAEQRALEPLIARLTLDVRGEARAEAGARVQIDERDVPAELFRVPIVLLPGPHVVRVRGDSVRAVDRTVTLVAGAQERVSLLLELLADPEVPVARPIAPPRPEVAPIARATAPSRGGATPFILGGTSLGVAAVAGGLTALFASLAQQRFEELSGPCQAQGVCVAETDPRLLDGRAYQTASNAALWSSVGFASVGLGSLLAGVVLRRGAGAATAPTVLAGAGGVALRLRY